ncbi:glutaredoxin, partial [Crepidotus variabilis]
TITDHPVVIFSKSWCPYCKAAKALFSTEFPDVKPEILELDLRDDGAEIQDYLLKKTNQRTVPSVFVNKEHIGGNDATQAAFKAGKLAAL